MIKLLAVLIFSCIDLFGSEIYWSQERLKLVPSALQFSNNNHRSSAPYISSDSFRAISDVVFDEGVTPLPRPENIKNGDIVFLNSMFMDEFFSKIHPYITNSYILVTNGYDASSPGEYLDLLEEPNCNIFHWFGANPNVKNNLKFTSIPIGLANSYWPHGDTNTLKKCINRLLEKKYLVSMNIDIGTNPQERQAAYNYFYKHNFCAKLPRKHYEEYLMDLKQSWFVVSPHGNGLDCHRTWEILLVGSYPIVKKSTLDELYQGLPVLIVDDWSVVTTSFLHEKIKEFEHKKINNEICLDRLFLNFYEKILLNKKEQCCGHLGIDK